jgi:asparagine synthase (glutamine-hydrolysing)
MAVGLNYGSPLLNTALLRAQRHFLPWRVTTLWRAFLAGERKWRSHLRTVLMFQAWREGLD